MQSHLHILGPGEDDEIRASGGLLEVPCKSKHEHICKSESKNDYKFNFEWEFKYKHSRPFTCKNISGSFPKMKASRKMILDAIR